MVLLVIQNSVNSGQLKEKSMGALEGKVARYIGSAGIRSSSITGNRVP
jgi:hypothetical protein